VSLNDFVKSIFRPQPPPARRVQITNPWHAVSILPGARCCESARRANQVRFLSKEAPSLPLVDCDAPVCTCRYRHHDDRRRSLRRACDAGMPSRQWQWTAPERRQSQGRRSVDGR